MEETSSIVRPDLITAAPASNLAFNEYIRSLMDDGRKIYHFAFGQSPFPLPKCLVDCLKEFAGVNAYLPTSGIIELREALIGFHKKYDDVDLDVENIIVAPGSKELIFLTLACFNGDIILPAPCWTTYAPQCRLAQKKFHIIRTTAANSWKLTVGQLKEALKANLHENKMLILNNPNNPSGICYTKEEMDGIITLCYQYRIIILSDEIYARLKFDGNHDSFAKHYPEGTILTSGFSKWASAGGWRLGYAHFPPQLNSLYNAVKSAASQTYSCASAPIQYALAKALTHHADELDKYIVSVRRILKAVGDYCHRELEKVEIAGVRSEGGYYFMPDFGAYREKMQRRGIFSGDQMSRALLDEANIALMGSRAFLAPENDLSTRFCFICFDGSVALEAIEKMESDEELTDEFVVEHCCPVVEGVTKLTEWVKRL